MLYYLSYLTEFHPFFNVFQYVTVRAGIAAVIALFFTFCFLPFLMKKLVKFGFLAQIRKKYFHHFHDYKNNIPTGGGLGIILAIFLTCLLTAKLNKWVIAVLITTLFFALLGFLDDWLKVKKKNSQGIKKSHKIIIESVFGLVLGIWLIFQKTAFPMSALSLPFLKGLILDLGIFYIFWVILVILGASNAVNLTDGLDGLAASSLIFVGIGYGILSYLSGHAILSQYLYIPNIEGSGELSIFCVSLVAATLGFLWYNSYPAQIFMGDVGSLPLGASLGLVALITKHELILPIIGGIFVIETLSVILQVISFRWKKKRIFKMTPLHHHFELKDWPEPKIVTRFQIISILLLVLGLLTLKLR